MIPSEQQHRIPSKFMSSILSVAVDVMGQERLNQCVQSKSIFQFSERSQAGLSYEDVNEILQALSEKMNDVLLPLDIGLALSAKNFGSFGRALYSSTSWAVWCKTAAKFAEYIGITHSSIKATHKQDQPILNFFENTQGLVYLDAFLTGALLKLYLLSSEAQADTKLYIRSGYHERLTNHQRLDCLVSAKTCLTIHFGDNAAKPRFANAKVHVVFIRDLAEADNEEVQHPLAFQVQNLIESQSGLYHVSQAWIAEQLHMSERNLLRKLKLANTSFRDLFNRVRSKRSLDLLFTGMTIADIASSLGYSERATFERAFKAWQGITPVAMQSRFARLAAEHNIENIVTAESIPAPPTMLLKLIGLIEDDDFHMDELVDLVESDPVITSKVMAIANSALYGYSGIDSVKQAILTVLGVEKLQAIVITILSTDVFSELPDYFPYDTFWFRSLAAAHISTVLADLNDVEADQRFTIYISALLHNIGHLGIAHCLSDGFHELTQENVESLSWPEYLNLQRLRLGIHSVQVTEMLLNLWDFPADIVKTLRASGTCADFLDSKVSKNPTTLNQTLRLVDNIEVCRRNQEDLTDVVAEFLHKEYGLASKNGGEIELVLKDIVCLISGLSDSAGSLV